MADPRRIAVTWFQALRALPKSRELAFKAPQFGDSRLHIRVATLDELGHDPARRAPRVADGDHLGDLGEGQANRLRGTDEAEPIHRIGTV